MSPNARSVNIFERKNSTNNWKYKAVKGDLIDEYFAEAIERSNLVGLKIERLEQGKYMFGSKKITAKI
jgi:hypothetical protein